MSETSTSSTASAGSPETDSDGLFVHAIIGAVVTIVTSFIPFSPIVGGAVAGYLHEHDGPKVGALSGLVAAVPVVLLVGFVLSVFLAIPVGAGGGPGVGVGIGIVLLFLAVLVVASAISAGLGAVGGYIGVYLKNEA